MGKRVRCLLILLLGISLVLGGVTSSAEAAVTSRNMSIEALKSRVSQSPNDLKARYLLARKLAAKQRWAEAVGHYQAILALRPVPAVMFHLGIALAKLGDLQNAVFQWDAIIKKYRPNNLTTLGYLGLALHKLARSQENQSRQFELHRSSLEYFKRILRLEPGNMKARIYAGAEYMKLGRPKQAVDQWVRAVRANPKSIQAWVLLTKGLARLRQLDKVRLAIRKILTLDPSNVFARKLQARLDRLKPDEAVVEDPIPVSVPGGRGMDDGGPVTSPGVDPNSPDEGGLARDPLDSPIPRIEEPDPLADPSPLGSPMNLQAEQLFLDGLDYKERGNFEKALYSFLQAIDIDPKFSQVYLQVGEVYLSLARLAPTKNQFEERIQLSIQALKQVGEFTPGSLLAHASRAKEVLVTRLQKQGFSGYHLSTAKRALDDDRPEDAFEEYVLLLSNAVFKPDVFYDLGLIVPKLTGGNMQDLQFFLEELYEQHRDSYLVEYLLGKTYLRLGKLNEGKSFEEKFIDHAEILATHVTRYIEQSGSKDTDPVDLFVSARLLIKRQDRRAAVQRLSLFLKKADKSSPFYSEALKLRTSLGEMLDAGQSKGFAEERDALVSEFPRLKAIFGEHFKIEHLDAKLPEDLKVFLTNHPENMLARYLVAWVTRVNAPKAGMMQQDLEQEAEDTFTDLLGQKSSNPDWHLEVGLHSLRWRLPDIGRAHLKVAGDLLILRGRLRSTRHANRVLEEASRFIGTGSLDEAAILLKQARILDIQSLNYFLIRSRFLFHKGRSADALYCLVEMVSVALGDHWFRLVVFTDLGLILFRATLLALLLLSALLVVRYYEDLHHLLMELWQQRGLLLPFSLAIAVFLVMVFPTGLVVFLPLLTWPMLRQDEKRSFLLLLGLLMVVPVILPVSLSDNFDLLRQAEQVRSGQISEARVFFEDFLSTHPADFNATYLLGLVGLMEGDEAGLKSARKIFSGLATRNPDESGPLVNLGNLEARAGNSAEALEFYNKALAKNPANTWALHNIATIYGRAGQTENEDKNLRWARSVARGPEQLARFEAASLPSSRALLMNYPLDDEKLDSYFTMAGTFGMLALNGPVVFFLCWFLFGGGLVGFLIFTRERLDVVMRRCHHCMRIICNNCQKVQDQKAYCAICVDPKSREKVSARDRQKRMREKAFKKAAAFNLIFPGSGFVFTGNALLGLCSAVLFLCLAMAAASKGGWLSNFLYTPVDMAPVMAIQMGLTLVALACFALLQAAFFRFRDRVS